MKKTSVFLSAVLLTAVMMSCAPAQAQSRGAGGGGASSGGMSGTAPTFAKASAPVPAQQPAQAPTHKPRKVAVYVTGGKTPNENKALNTRITHALVSSGKYNTIERSDAFLAQVAKEMAAQRSGAIDDRQISALGQQAGADFVCIGEIVEVFGAHQISARIVNVVSVEVIASGIALGRLQTIEDFAALSNEVVASLLGETAKVAPVGATPGGYAAQPAAQASRPAAPPQPAAGQHQSAAPAPSGYAAQPAPQASSPAAPPSPPIMGVLVPGVNLTTKLAWLQRSADSHNTYIVAVNADENISPHTFEYKGAINVTVVIRGDNVNRTIRLQTNGTMFTVTSNVTLILENNITLRGHKDNNNPMVSVGGTLKMHSGATITGNTGGYYGGGVFVSGGRTFEMTGGLIAGNGNSANDGGGVYVHGAFTMSGGTISGNIARSGGGVYGSGTVTMRGGTITGNTAIRSGAGVYASGTFIKTGGVITGYSSDPSNGNVVRDDNGDVIARNGHAVFVSSDQRKETTSGAATRLDKSKRGAEGGWD